MVLYTDFLTSKEKAIDYCIGCAIFLTFNILIGLCWYLFGIAATNLYWLGGEVHELFPTFFVVPAFIIELLEPFLLLAVALSTAATLMALVLPALISLLNQLIVLWTWMLDSGLSFFQEGINWISKIP